MSIHVESDDQCKQLIDEQGPKGKAIFIKFSAKWCGPCKHIAPHYERLAQENPNNVFISLDVDECENVAKDFKIRGMPTFVVVKDDKEVSRIVGADRRKLIAVVESFVE